MMTDPTAPPRPASGSTAPATTSSRFRMTWATSTAGSRVPVSFEYDDAPPRLTIRDLVVLASAALSLAMAVAAFWQLVG